MSTQPEPEVINKCFWWPPSWLVVTAFAAIFVVVLGGFFTWYEITEARTDARIRCERVVEIRNESRMMWIALFDAFPQEAEETGLRLALEQRLPPLACDGTTPVVEAAE